MARRPGPGRNSKSLAHWQKPPRAATPPGNEPGASDPGRDMAQFWAAGPDRGGSPGPTRTRRPTSLEPSAQRMGSCRPGTRSHAGVRAGPAGPRPERNYTGWPVAPATPGGNAGRPGNGRPIRAAGRGGSESLGPALARPSESIMGPAGAGPEIGVATPRPPTVTRQEPCPARPGTPFDCARPGPDRTGPAAPSPPRACAESLGLPGAGGGGAGRRGAFKISPGPRSGPAVRRAWRCDALPRPPSTTG